MSNFVDVLQANLCDHEDKVTTTTIRFFMMAYEEVLKNEFQYERDLAQFGRDVREEFESMWVFEDGVYNFQYPPRRSRTDETWCTIREKHHEHLVTTMGEIGCTNVDELPTKKRNFLVKLVGRDVDENLGRVRLEIESAKERLVVDTARNDSFCREHTGWSEVKFQKLRRLGEECFDIFVMCKKVGATTDEMGELFIAGALIVNGDEDALVNFGLGFT